MIDKISVVILVLVLAYLGRVYSVYGADIKLEGSQVSDSFSDGPTDTISTPPPNNNGKSFFSGRYRD